jgi:hypothetical protein
MKLKRDVALKVLPPEFSDDANGMRRVQQTEVLAALNLQSDYGFDQSNRPAPV